LDKHYVLEADIDLNPVLLGGKVFSTAVIAPDTNDVTIEFNGFSYTGVFDGNGYTISHLTIMGERYLGLFGLLGPEAEVKKLGVEDTNITGSGMFIGGLVGLSYGTLIQCYSTGEVSGTGINVGGLVGLSYGTLIQCYSTDAVSGTDRVGGLVGYGDESRVIESFWDVNTSGIATSEGGEGKTTQEMLDPNTFLTAGWDFVGETANGIEDVWFMPENDTPRLVYSPRFSDPNLKKAIEAQMEIPDPNIVDVLKLTELDAQDSNIVDLSGLEKAVNLTVLKLSSNQIQDVNALANLTKLSTLWLEDNQVTSIESIGNLINLNYLLLSRNRIANFEPLCGLTGLTTLYLIDTNDEISDIPAGMLTLPQLKWVNLKGNAKLNKSSPNVAKLNTICQGRGGRVWVD
jgi:hypothetical protein